MLSLVLSMNHRALSGPVAISVSVVLGMAISLIMPAVVMRPILPPPSTNQSAPSGPAAMPRRLPEAAGGEVDVEEVDGHRWHRNRAPLKSVHH